MDNLARERMRMWSWDVELAQLSLGTAGVQAPLPSPSRFFLVGLDRWPLDMPLKNQPNPYTRKQHHSLYGIITKQQKLRDFAVGLNLTLAVPPFFHLPFTSPTIATSTAQYSSMYCSMGRKSKVTIPFTAVVYTHNRVSDPLSVCVYV